MKIEQLIVQHLYNSKKVTLEDIGTFFLSANVTILENDKEIAMPDNAVRFEFQKKAPQDDALIAYIVTQTRKIKPLATSDLESYSILARQFLNIGKPFPIEGLGVLQKNQEGDYEFLQGNYINARLDAAPALLKEKTEDQISFSTPAKASPGNRKWMWIVLFAFLLVAAAALYYLLKKDEISKEAEILVPVADTVAVLKDTVATPIDTAAARVTIPIQDSTVADVIAPVQNAGNSFMVVINEYPSKDIGDKSFVRLRGFGHKVVLYPTTSSTYKIGYPFTRPLSDTIHLKDSLKKYFTKRNLYVEVN